jgi:hypothetical protein
MLGIAALAFAGVTGSLIAVTPAQAAYVAPFVPTGCTEVSIASYPYPYELSTAPTTTGWYVYCGANPTVFKARAGDLLKNLPTSNPPELRQKFQAYNYTLYVFETAAQAQTLMGAAAFPADTQVNGVLGVHKPSAVGNATTGFVSIFEKPKNASGTPTEYTGSALFNFDEVLYHETGHAIDNLATTSGSSSNGANQFRPRVIADISAFNAKNGCALSGPDSTLWNTWGARKTTICDGAGNKRTTPVNYAAKTNLQIVREFYPTSTAWTQYFQNTAVYNELWSQLIAIKRGGAGLGAVFAETDAWIVKIYPCGKLYTDQIYTNWTTPTATCP